MFTGLVEALGNVISLESLGDQARLMLDLPFASELALGDSVAINGCCLTVAEFTSAGVAFDLLAQTLRVTSRPSWHWVGGESRTRNDGG